MSQGVGNLGRERCLAEYLGRGDVKLVSGTHTTVAASDTVSTKLSTVLAAFANLDDDPAAACEFATAVPSGSDVLIKTWNSTQGAASSFSKTVRWFAIGY